MFGADPLFVDRGPGQNPRHIVIDPLHWLCEKSLEGRMNRASNLTQIYNFVKPKDVERIEIPVPLGDLQSLLNRRNQPLLAFHEDDPRAFVFDGKPGAFKRDDWARYARVLYQHADETMSLAKARKVDMQLPVEKIKGGFKVNKLPPPFCDCIVKVSGHRGFRFDSKRLTDYELQHGIEGA